MTSSPSRLESGIRNAKDYLGLRRRLFDGFPIAGDETMVINVGRVNPSRRKGAIPPLNQVINGITNGVVRKDGSDFMRLTIGLGKGRWNTWIGNRHPRQQFEMRYGNFVMDPFGIINYRVRLISIYTNDSARTKIERIGFCCSASVVDHD